MITIEHSLLKSTNLSHKFIQGVPPNNQLFLVFLILNLVKKLTDLSCALPEKKLHIQSVLFSLGTTQRVFIFILLHFWML